jgi:hypothetical protein
MNAKARPAPATLADEPGPRGCGGEDLADALGEEAQGAQGHVAVLGSEDHVLDGGDLGGRELAGHGARTWGAIVEAADHSDASPRVVARGRHTEDSQDQRERQSKRPAPGIFSDIRHAAVAYRFVRNVPERSWVPRQRRGGGPHRPRREGEATRLPKQLADPGALPGSADRGARQYHYVLWRRRESNHARVRMKNRSAAPTCARFTQG